MKSLNREKLVASVRILRHFIDQGLGLFCSSHKVTGFELCEPLLDASAYNTYVETVGDKADTLYLRVKDSLTEMVTYSYLENVRRFSDKFGWNDKAVVLAFDYTDEEFYGDVQGLEIHGWTGKNGVSGKFKFLTCSIVSDDIPEKIPLISIPILLGHNKSHAIEYCLSRIKDYVGEIILILFDRGFYDNNLMYELSQNERPYLIFVPKQRDKAEILYAMQKGDQFVMIHNYSVNKDKSYFKGETYLAFLKEIYDPKSEKEYDWVFATNVGELQLSEMIKTYKKRWRIETSFRVQDEARIKCKSKEMKIRYFIFMFQQMLQTQWVCFYKEEVSFKQFLIEMQKTCKSVVANPKRSFRKKLESKAK